MLLCVLQDNQRYLEIPLLKPLNIQMLIKAGSIATFLSPQLKEVFSNKSKATCCSCGTVQALIWVTVIRVCDHFHMCKMLSQVKNVRVLIKYSAFSYSCNLFSESNNKLWPTYVLKINTLLWMIASNRKLIPTWEWSPDKGI